MQGDDLVLGDHAAPDVGDVVLGRHVLDDVSEHLANLVERCLLCHAGIVAHAVFRRFLGQAGQGRR